MRARKVREVQTLLRSEAFVAWHARYRAAREELHNGRQGLEDPVLEAVLRGGEHQNAAVRSHAEFTNIENDSFELLSAYETQRLITSDSWIEHERADKILEDLRAEASELRAQLDAARKIGKGVEASAAQLAAIEDRVANQAKQCELLAQRLDAAKQKKDEIWRKVEATWSIAFRANMARSEHAYLAKLAAGEAQRYVDSEASRRQLDGGEGKRMAEAVRVGAVRLEALMEEARQAWEAAGVTSFLFWPHDDDVTSALCVPLHDDRDHLNIQVSALALYQVDRTRGLDLLEPVLADKGVDVDPRLDAFFLEGRAVN